MSADPTELEALLADGPPIVGSSVPAGVANAYRYASRLENRYYADQAKIIKAIRLLTLAHAELRLLRLSRHQAVAEAAVRECLEVLS